LYIVKKDQELTALLTPNGGEISAGKHDMHVLQHVSPMFLRADNGVNEKKNEHYLLQIYQRDKCNC
jgi:hypothetical protein